MNLFAKSGISKNRNEFSEYCKYWSLLYFFYLYDYYYFIFYYSFILCKAWFMIKVQTQLPSFKWTLGLKGRIKLDDPFSTWEIRLKMTPRPDGYGLGPPWAREIQSGVNKGRVIGYPHPHPLSDLEERRFLRVLWSTGFWAFWASPPRWPLSHVKRGTAGRLGCLQRVLGSPDCFIGGQPLHPMDLQ